MAPITDSRRTLIVEELSRSQIVKVADLSDHFGISEVSIRRDLQYLEHLGLLRRVHGGAISISSAPSVVGMLTKMKLTGEHKEHIGRAAAEMIHNGDRLIIDSGSTPLEVARNINRNLLTSGNLTIITAYLPVVQELGHRPGIHLILLGGIYLPAYQVNVGPQTLDQLKGLHADKLFLGTDGISLSQGLTSANLLEAEVSRAMVKAAAEVIVVCDSSKIDVISLANIMPIADITKLITDQDASPEFVAHLKDYGIEVILV